MKVDVSITNTEGETVHAAELLTEPQTDIFAWANNLMADKEDYAMQLFFISKNNVPYSLNNAASTTDPLRVLFMDNMMEAVLDGAETGMLVRKYEDTTRGDGMLSWLALDKVTRAAGMTYWVERQATEVERFTPAEHDIKRQAGIFAKFTLEGKPTFYIFKQFDPNKSTVAKKDFVLNGDAVEMMRADASFKIDPNPQVLVIGGDVFVFNQGKFESLFNMKPHQLAVANQNGAIIDERFNLSMPLLVQEIGILAQKSPAAIKKLSAIDPYLMSPDQVDEAIEEFDIELMHDDAGKLILMDDKDVMRFLDVLSDNYVHGSSGNDYLAKTKKLLQTEE